jgi:hypothetical protein
VKCQERDGWLADMIEMHRRLTFVDKNSKDLKKKKKKLWTPLFSPSCRQKFKRKKILDAILSKLQTCISTNPLFLSFHPKSFPSHQSATPSLHNLRLPSTPQQQPPPTSDTNTRG